MILGLRQTENLTALSLRVRVFQSNNKGVGDLISNKLNWSAPLLAVYTRICNLDLRNLKQFSEAINQYYCIFLL